MKLYNYFRSSASYRVRIALELKGLPYEYVSIQLAQGEQLKPEFQGISADGLVPLLEMPDGTRISQSLAIMEFLDDLHPSPPLLPGNATERARIRALSLSIACEVHPLNNLRVLRYLTQELKADEEAKNTWYRHWVRGGLEAFERQLEQRPLSRFCAGDAPTMADCCLVPQIFNAKRFNTPLEGLPRTMAAYDACSELEAFQKAHPSVCPDATA